MTDDRWIEARRTGIGGSDAPVVLGLSRWRTPYELWREKRGEGDPQPESDAMRWGRALEPLVRAEYIERTGRSVVVPDAIMRHARYPWMIATLDGITDGGRIVEIKTARSSEGWGEPGTDEVPDVYIVQVQHYMIVTGAPVADIAVLIAGHEYRQYEIQADTELQQAIIEAEAEFWQRVESGEPPDPVTEEDARRRWPRSSEGAARIADSETAELVRRLHEIQGSIDSLSAAASEIKTQIMAAMGDAERLIAPDGTILATWRSSKPVERLDVAALKQHHPDLYCKFLRAGEPVRRFLLK